MAEQEGIEQLQIQEFEANEYSATIESPINLYNLDCYFNLPPSSPFSDIVLSPLWNSPDCSDTGNSAAESSTSVITWIADSPWISSHDKSYSDGSTGSKKQNSLGFCYIKERICQAVGYILSMGKDILVQFWAPMKRNNRCVLATYGQPFALDPTNTSLMQYRNISQNYNYFVDGSDDGYRGIPGRVFQTKFPEWTPNVQYYSSKEFPQVDYALRYNIRGILALPVFEGGRCIGVLELIMTSQKIKIAVDLEKVCKALESPSNYNLLRAVDLYYSGTFDERIDAQTSYKDFKVDQLEILEMFHAVCEMHKLPLAQTWLPMSYQNAAYGDTYTKLSCLSTSAFYVTEVHMWDFREACMEHQLQDGQGLPGRTVASFSACFCADVCQFSKSEYPLVHYAREFGLQSSLTIPICSSHSVKDSTYVLEFFLPHSSTDRKILWQIAASVLSITKDILQNSKVLKWIEPEEGGHAQIIDLSVGEKFPFEPVPTRHGLETSQSVASKEQDLPMQQRPEHNTAARKAESDANAENIAFSIFEKDGKMTLQVLKQLYGKNLNDAANCLGGPTNSLSLRDRDKVCLHTILCRPLHCSSLYPLNVVSRSTFKRLCRKHGISRWPRMKKTRSNTPLTLSSKGKIW